MPELREIVENWKQYCQESYKASEIKGDKKAEGLFYNLAETFNDVLKYMDESENRLRPLPKNLGDLSDLPEEVLNELNVIKTDELDNQLIDVIRANGGTADLDEILVGLYRKFRVKQKRRFLQNKLYRISKRGLIESVPKKKGVYALPQIDDSTAEPSNDFEKELSNEIPF